MWDIYAEPINFTVDRGQTKIRYKIMLKEIIRNN